jgi:hypothetical protein
MRYMVTARVKLGRDDEERPYWEEFFELVRVQDAHARHVCRDENGSEPWACSDCDCTAKLEARLQSGDRSFLDALRAAVDPSRLAG